MLGMLSASCPPPLLPSCADRKENGDYLGVVQIYPGEKKGVELSNFSDKT